MEGVWQVVSPVVAPLSAGIIPLIGFWVVLTNWWDFSAQPAWAWATISLVPLCMLLLLLPARHATRLYFSIVVSHAATMIWLVVIGQWNSVAKTGLLLDVYFIVVSLPTLAGVPGRFTRATVLWIAMLFGVGFPLALAHGAVVAWRAEAVAGERPYCIQYASQTDSFAYEPARTLFDLSALKMQARLVDGGSSTFHFQHHAILVVDDGARSFFNWSYGREAFLDEVANRAIGRGPEVICQPERHFAKHLSIWRREPTRIEMSISGRSFSIPEAYRPRAHGDRIIINAVPPDFAPYDISNKGQLHIAQFYSNIVVIAADMSDLAADLKRWLESGREAKPVDGEFGLNKTLLYFGKLTRLPDRRVFSTVYAGYDGDGRVTKLMECNRKGLDLRTPTCRYQFVSDGLLFGLTIPDPSEWQTIERRLTETFASFGSRPDH
jgi:hypothetical protein